MGLEPTTFWMQTRRSSQLSYVPVNGNHQATHPGIRWHGRPASRQAGPMLEPDHLQRYAEAHVAVLAALGGITPAELDRRPAPDCPTAREVVHHLADSETRSYLRLRTLLAADNAFIEPYDEAAWAAETRLGYATHPIEPSLAVLVAVRHSSHELLRTLDPEALTRVGHHPEHDRPYTLALWLEIYSEHPYVHADQITRARRGER